MTVILCLMITFYDINYGLKFAKKLGNLMKLF